MTTIVGSKKDFEELVGKKFTALQLEDVVLYGKGELDKCEGDELAIEISDSNRPDLWSFEGFCRQIRPFYNLKENKPLPTKVPSSGLSVRIEKSVKSVRPFTVCGVAKNVMITKEVLDQLIQLQEKVCMGFGRKRREAAVGIYDLDQIKGPIRYYGADPKVEKFSPLGFESEMTLVDILELHPKGKEFGNLIKDKNVFPLFRDANNCVLSMPPIINSNEAGQVEVGRRNLFVEVSGFNPKTISTVLNVMMMALFERGAKLESVVIVDADGTKSATPNLAPKKAQLSGESFRKMSGLSLNDKEILALLRKMGYEGKVNKKRIELTYPAYRQDILHEMDVAEDALIAYDYNQMVPLDIKLGTMGAKSKRTLLWERHREALIGLGLQEVVTPHLTSMEKQRDLILLPKDEMFVEIENYMSLSYQLFKKRNFPELLAYLAKNKHVELPHGIFEIGTVLEVNEKKENGTQETDVACMALERKSGTINDIRSLLQTYAAAMGKNFTLKAENAPFAINGRSAIILIDGKHAGMVFEVKPEVLVKFGLENPVVIAEIRLE